MTIMEPTTMLTDYLLTVVCLIFGLRLLNSSRVTGNHSVMLWAIGFLVLAAAALVGGSYHGFAAYFSEGVSRALWNLTVFLIGACGGFMISGSIAGLPPKRSLAAKLLIGGVLVSLGGFMIQQSGLVFHTHFNHNDLFHITQLGGLFLFYRGARLLRDR